MIPCKKCGHENLLTSMFCHGCGVRIEVSYAQVATSVVSNNAAQRDLSILGWGRSAVSLASFLLICALVLRYVAVPNPPPAYVPEAPDVALFTGDPAWAAAAATPPADAAAPVMATADGSRLAWRQRHGVGVLSAFSIDFRPLQVAQKTLQAAQKPDGGFAGDDAMCATALATLALQAWPANPEILAAAAKGRAWVDAAWKTLPQRPALARALAAAVLADAQTLSDARRQQLGALLVDGSSPMWQAFLLPLLDDKRRPKDVIALQNKLSGQLWGAWFGLCVGQPIEIDNSFLFGDAAAKLPTAEERFLWAQVAWLHPVAPEEYATTLRGWAAAAPIKPDAATAKACGATATTALGLLVATAPLRVPALQLSR